MKKILCSILVAALVITVLFPTVVLANPCPSITIVKTTQDCDGTWKDGANVVAGGTVTWKYEIDSNNYLGESPTGITVTDPGVTPTRISGDTNGNNRLDVNEIWIYTATGIAVAGGPHYNIGTVTYTGYYDCDGGFHTYTQTATDNSWYTGGDAKIAINKTTNGGDGVEIAVDQPVTWQYVVTNEGSVALSDINVTDSVPGVTPAYVSGDDGDNELENAETWIYTAAGTAIEGEYSNIGTVTGKWECCTVTDSDGSSYYNRTGQEPPPTEVGGTIYPANKIALLGPFVVLALTLFSGAFFVVRRRQTQKY